MRASEDRRCGGNTAIAMDTAYQRLPAYRSARGQRASVSGQSNNAPSALCGIEIEIAHRGETRAFVHTEVRERVLPEGSVYAGVFVALDEGDYTLLDVAGPGLAAVTIRSGQVTEVVLPG